MSNRTRICPVCGAPQRDPSSLVCSACRCPFAFHTLFSGEKAFAMWQEAINKYREIRELCLYADSRDAGCTLQLTGNSFCFHNPKTAEAVICGFDGSSPTVLKDVRQVSLDSLYRLELHRDGTVSASGDDYYGQKRGLSRITDAAFVAAAPTCAFVVSEEGQVTEHGLNDFGGELADWTQIRRVAANQLHIVGIKKDGTVVCAASGNSPVRPFLREADNWTQVKDVAVAAKYILALHENGTVSYAGPPGSNAAAGQWRNIVAIAADSQYAVGLTAEGKVLLAGDELPFVDYGRKAAAQWTDMTFIAAGGSMILGLTNKGGIRMSRIPGNGENCEAAFADSIRAILK